MNIIKFNLKRLVIGKKDIVNIIKISLSSLVSYFILTTPFYLMFPQVENYTLCIKIIIFVSFSYYMKNLFDLNLFGKNFL